jgi:hypothetical protein
MTAVSVRSGRSSSGGRGADLIRQGAGLLDRYRRVGIVALALAIRKEAPAAGYRDDVVGCIRPTELRVLERPPSLSRHSSRAILLHFAFSPTFGVALADDVPRGSCFSSRSAPGRLMIFRAALPMMVGRVCGHYELTSPVVPVRTASCRSRTR